MGERYKRLDIKTGFICNNNCRFCVQADNKCVGNRTYEEIKKDLIESKNRCGGVVLTGGEATIRKDFFEIIKLAKELDYKKIQIQTNGRMFSSLDFCKKTIEAGATEFSPAIHGYCSEQHDYLTNSPGSFNETIKGIKNLKSLGAYILTNTVVVKSNYRDIPKIAHLLVKLNVDQFQFAFVHPMGNAWKNFENTVPRISLAIPYIHRGLEIGIRGRKKVMTEAIPYCFMKGYEKYVAERIIPETEIRGREYQNTDSFDKERKEKGKIKFEKCKKCKYYVKCEGPWREYPEKYGDGEFNPVNVIKKEVLEKIKIYEKINKKRIKNNLGFLKGEGLENSEKSKFSRENIRSIWKNHLIELNEKNETEEKLGLYLHTPFCIKKCHYCLYDSIPFNQKLIKKYLDSIKFDSEYFKETFRNKNFDTLYWGGGTPNILKEEELETLLNNIFNCFNFKKNAEITIEYNPLFHTRKKIKILKKYGFNKISIGVQSFDEEVLCKANRGYQKKEDIYQTIKDCNEEGIDGTNIDIILGLEKDNNKKFLETFEKTLALHPKSVMIYKLVTTKHYYSNLSKKGKRLENSIICERYFIPELFKKIKEIAKERGYEYNEKDFTLDRNNMGIGFVRKELINSIRDGYSFSSSKEYASSCFGLGFLSKSHIYGKIFYLNNEEDFNCSTNKKVFTGNEITPNREIYKYLVEKAIKKESIDVLEINKKFKIDFLTKFKENLKEINSMKFASVRKNKFILNYEKKSNCILALMLLMDKKFLKMILNIKPRTKDSQIID